MYCDSVLYVLVLMFLCFTYNPALSCYMQ